MAWQKGQSGNPNGSSGPRRFHAAIERALAQDNSDKLRKAVDAMLDAAAEGQPWAIQFLADRLDGKADQTIRVARDAKQLSDADLADIAASSGDGTPESEIRPEVPSSVH